MKILFFGRTQSNSGPENLNRQFYAHLTEAFVPASPEGDFRAVLADLKKLTRCDALVVSGLSRKSCVLVGLAKLLGKRTVYILHGLVEYEQRANDLQDAAAAKQERFLLKHCSAVLPVSRWYRDWLAQRHPALEGKLSWLYPGATEIPGSINTEKHPGTVLAAGGDRPMKNNLALAQAVEELAGEGKLEVCGAARQTDFLAGFAHSRYLGLLPQETFWEKLGETELFVVNSTVESFSLSALEALDCGCSLLISQGAGVCDLLDLQEEDCIRDPMDTQMLKNKIQYLLEHPNNARLRARVWRWEDTVARLEAICREGEKS